MEVVWIVVERYMYDNLPEYISAVFSLEHLADNYISVMLKNVKGTDRKSHMFIKREWLVNDPNKIKKGE